MRSSDQKPVPKSNDIRKFAFAVLALIRLQMPAYGATLELVPMVGYQFNGSKDLAGPRNDRLNFKNVALRGFSVGILNKEDAELEFSWTRAYSAAAIQRSGGALPDRFDIRIDRLHLNALFMLTQSSIQPFLLLGMGGTRYTPANELSSTTRFSLALGGGVKWLWNDHIGLRVDARWTPSLVPAGTHFFCDPTGTQGCYSTEANSYVSRVYPFLNNVEFTSGLLIRY